MRIPRYAGWVMLLAVPLSHAYAADTEKTLVTWVYLANATQRGGSALTVQRGEQFDGIVFGEKQAGRWMAGSEFYKRTQAAQDAYAAETADEKTRIQMASVYTADTISIYRNGELLVSYPAQNADLLRGKDRAVVFGIRHIGAGSGEVLQGAIEDARVYDRALTAEQLKALVPNQPSDPAPYAWWSFKDGEAKDRMGRYAQNVIAGGAKVENGRLLLGDARASLFAFAEAGDAARLKTRLAEGKAMPNKTLLYHLMHPGPSAAPADPNPAFCVNGVYHLHYIYNDARGFSFAHVSSTDMLNWTWHKTSLQPSFTGHGMFSGTGFITKDGRTAMIYHGEGSNRNQIAIAKDASLDEWEKPYPIEPSVKPGQDASMLDHWDPDCFLVDDTYYAIFGGNPGRHKPATLVKSKDLKNWAFVGPFLKQNLPEVQKDEDISCPNFFRIGSKWMLLCISHNKGCRYYLGEFRDEQFVPETHARMNWRGRMFFAPESVLTPDGRRVMWAWCLADREPFGFAGIQSLPRELSLPDDGVLRIKPLRELEALRGDERHKTGIEVEAGAVKLDDLQDEAVEVRAVLASSSAEPFGLRLFCGAESQGLPVLIDPKSKTLQVGETRAPFDAPPGPNGVREVELRVFVDRYMVEVFANDRQAVLEASLHSTEDKGLSVVSTGGSMTVKDLRIWKLKPTNQGYLEAVKSGNWK
jgi:beta-fructofuranosidase